MATKSLSAVTSAEVDELFHKHEKELHRKVDGTRDAYFGFITFFCWLAWRERSLGIKIVWFVLIMALGNIAMSLYVLIQLFGLRADEPASALFRQKAA